MSGGLAQRGPYGKKGYKLTLELTHGLTGLEPYENVSFEQLLRLVRPPCHALDELFCQPEFVKKGEVLCEFPCE